MTQEFENMLYLFGCGALGKEPLAKHCDSIKRIRDVSITQNVWPIVYSAIRKKLSSGEVVIPQDIYSKLEMSFQVNMGKALQQNEFNKQTIRTLEKNGVECCLFKGISLAGLYDIPETRVSADADILIDEKDEKKAAVILAELGYDIKERAAYDHHMCAIHPIGGMMEVHVSIMRKNWDDIIFSNKISYNEKRVELENGIRVLGINDALINTTTHFIKHFVRKGAGVRHMMDMLLYMKKYENQINWEYFNSLMKELRYDRLVDVVKTLGVKYWGFSFSDFNEVDSETLEKFLTDIEQGGIFGWDDEKRVESYAQFTQRRKKFSAWEYKRYSVNNMDRTFMQKLFPDKEYMKKNYKMRDNSLFSLIKAHIRRAINIVRCLISGKRDFNSYVYGERKEISQQVKERMNLFERLNIID